METIEELKKICQPHRSQTQRPNDWGYLKHRELSIYITKVILKMGGSKIKPNHLSIFNILFGVMVLSLIALTGDKLFFLLLLLLFYFSFLLDKVDGEVARYQKVITLKGNYLDEIYHLFVQQSLILAVAINHSLAYLGIAGFLLFLVIRYLNKIKYFIYAKYRPDRAKFLMSQELGEIEKLVVSLLNIFPLKLCSLARRHDIFLLIVFIFSIFYFNLEVLWFWFLLGWSALLTVNVLRFLILNFLFIDRDVQLVDESKL